MKKLKTMTLSEFEKRYRKNNTNWKFDLFKIVCKKCGSERVEYNGKTEVDYGYYGSIDFIGTIVVKCHKCGNAFEIRMTDGGTSHYCQHDL